MLIGSQTSWDLKAKLLGVSLATLLGRVHVHGIACAAIAPLMHVEYSHDHARIEGRLFDGVLQPVRGALRPDEGRPGLGLTLREADAVLYER